MSPNAGVATTYEYASTVLTVKQTLTPPNSGDSYVALYSGNLAILQTSGDSGSGKFHLISE